MFNNNFNLNDPQLREIVNNTSEAELTDMMLMSLKELWKNPAQLNQVLAGLPPFVRDQLKNMPPNDATLRPMAQMTAQMLRSEIKGGGSQMDMFKQAQSMMNDPGMSSWINSMLGQPGGAIEEADEEPPEQWTELMDRALLAMNQENAEEIEHCLIEALQLVEPQPNDPLCLFETLQYLVSFYLQEERYDDAEPFLKMWIKRGEKRFGKDNEIIIGAYISLGAVREQQKKISDADVLYGKGLALAEKHLADAPAELADIVENVACFFERQKMYRKSDPIFKRAIQLRQQDSEEEIALAEQNLKYALALLDRGTANEAQPYVERAIAIKRYVLDESDPDLLRTQTVLGALKLAQGNLDEAETILKTSIASLEEQLEKDEDMIYPLEQLMKLLAARGLQDEAEKVRQRIAAIDAADNQ